MFFKNKYTREEVNIWLEEVMDINMKQVLEN